MRQIRGSSNRVVARLAKVLWAQADVAAMNRRRGVVNILHRDALRHVGSCESGRHSDQRDVKADVGKPLFQAVAGEKVEPFLRWAFGSLVGFRFAGGAKIFEQGDEVWVKDLRRCHVAFLGEGDAPLVLGDDIHVRHRIEVSRCDAHAVMVGDLERVVEEGAFWFGFSLDLLSDDGDGFRGEFGFDVSRCLAFDLEIVNRVEGGVFSQDGFGHDDAEEFDFEKRGVVDGFVFAVPWIWGLPPSHVVEAVFATDLARQFNILFFQKHLESAPGGVGARSGVGRCFVAQVNPVSDPEVPPFSGGVMMDLPFAQSEFGGEGFGASGVCADADLEPCALGFDFEVNRVAVVEPPKLGIRFFVEACHRCRDVSISWQKRPKTIKSNRTPSSPCKLGNVSPVRFRPQPPLLFQGFLDAVSIKCRDARFSAPFSRSVFTHCVGGEL